MFGDFLGVPGRVRSQCGLTRYMQFSFSDLLLGCERKKWPKHLPQMVVLFKWWCWIPWWMVEFVEENITLSNKKVVIPLWMRMFPKIVGVPPKSSILIEFSTRNHPFWGIPSFGNTHDNQWNNGVNYDGLNVGFPWVILIGSMVHVQGWKTRAGMK